MTPKSKQTMGVNSIVSKGHRIHSTVNQSRTLVDDKRAKSKQLIKSIESLVIVVKCRQLLGFSLHY